MSEECFLCGEKVRHRKLYRHLFDRHDYTKEQLDKLKRHRAEAKKRGDPEKESEVITCENCDKDFSLRNSFLVHQRHCIQLESDRNVVCPECGESARDLKDLVKHCSSSHGPNEEYHVNKLAFDNNDDFEAKFNSSMDIQIEYCLAHIGHEGDPSQLWLAKSDEMFVVELLRGGLNYDQVKRKTRKIARRNNLLPGRRDSNDILSLEKRIDENNINDGFRYYAPSIDSTGDGFCLVIINETQKRWLAEFSHKGIGIDDTFNVFMYKLRLATIIVADNCDRGLPAAFLLSFRMSENELAILFDKVRKLCPYFSPTFFMSDDASSFYNAFRKVFPGADTRKILCNWHVLQSFKRSARKKLTKQSLLGEFMTRVRLVSKSSAAIFTKRFGDCLTLLLKENENEMVNYMHQNWTHRIEEWSAHHRKGAVMNTSMMCERWHKHLKREVFLSKSKIRIDELTDALITTVREMDVDRAVLEHRVIVEGRWRPKIQNLNHNKAITDYQKSKELIDVVGPGIWTVRSHRSDKAYLVEEEQCSCKKLCIEGRLSDVHKELVETTGDSTEPDESAEGLAEVTSTQQLNPTYERRTDTATTSTQQFHSTSEVVPTLIRKQRIEMKYAAFHSTLRRMAAIFSEEAEEYLNEALTFMKLAHSVLKDRLSAMTPTAEKEPSIALRNEVSLRGPAPADAKPIRLKTASSLNRKKRRTKCENPKEFTSAEVLVCGICFLEFPINSEGSSIYWLKCTLCNTWAHMGCCVVKDALCSVCSKGTMQYSEA